jgi:hypothetical protein
MGTLMTAARCSLASQDGGIWFQLFSCPLCKVDSRGVWSRIGLILSARTTQVGGPRMTGLGRRDVAEYTHATMVSPSSASSLNLPSLRRQAAFRHIEGREETMARTPLLRALRRLALEHDAAERLGLTPAELRRRRTELLRRDFLKGAAAIGALAPHLTVRASASCATGSRCHHRSGHFRPHCGQGPRRHRL